MHGARPVSAPRVSALTVASTMPAERSRLVPAESIPQAASAGSAWVGRTVPAIEGTPGTAALTEAAIATGTSGSRPVRPRLACQPGPTAQYGPSLMPQKTTLWDRERRVFQIGPRLHAQPEAGRGEA